VGFSNSDAGRVSVNTNHFRQIKAYAWFTRLYIRNNLYHWMVWNLNPVTPSFVSLSIC